MIAYKVQPCKLLGAFEVVFIRLTVEVVCHPFCLMPHQVQSKCLLARTRDIAAAANNHTVYYFYLPVVTNERVETYALALLLAFRLILKIMKSPAAALLRPQPVASLPLMP